jgi:hypothetical protein
MVFQKASFGRPSRPSRRQKPCPPNCGERPFRDPAFHETIVILVPLGPSVFQNIIFSMMTGYFSVLFCFSLCYVLYVIFITFVEKTSVNAQPLSPPIFEKIVPDFKNNVCSYFVSFRLRFLYFHIFVDFRLPLPPPPLAQIGPICGRFWSHFCSVLVQVGKRSRLLKLFRRILGHGGTIEDQKINRKIETTRRWTIAHFVFEI